MGIEATSSATSTVSISSASSTSSSNAATKTNSDSSFKEEMSKVSETEKKENTKAAEKNSKTDKKDASVKEDKKETKTETKSETKSKKTENNNQLNQGQDSLNNPLGINPNQMTMTDANMLLSNDIQQMIENTASINGINQKGWGLTLGDGSKSNIKMSESDADFFINLTQNDSVNIQQMTSQAQNMINNGADAKEVKQNFQVSQTLLNALSESRENNQPVRIDFDQNVSVILRVGKDGALSAQFIPGDKAVENYLRQNIDSLRSTFDEQELPYSDLSYSNSSKEQNQRRRQQQRQGE